MNSLDARKNMDSVFSDCNKKDLEFEILFDDSDDSIIDYMIEASEEFAPTAEPEYQKDGDDSNKYPAEGSKEKKLEDSDENGKGGTYKGDSAESDAHDSSFDFTTAKESVDMFGSFFTEDKTPDVPKAPVDENFIASLFEESEDDSFQSFLNSKIKQKIADGKVMSPDDLDKEEDVEENAITANSGSKAAIAQIHKDQEDREDDDDAAKDECNESVEDLFETFFGEDSDPEGAENTEEDPSGDKQECKEATEDLFGSFFTEDADHEIEDDKKVTLEEFDDIINTMFEESNIDDLDDEDQREGKTDKQHDEEGTDDSPLKEDADFLSTVLGENNKTIEDDCDYAQRNGKADIDTTDVEGVHAKPVAQASESVEAMFSSLFFGESEDVCPKCGKVPCECKVTAEDFADIFGSFVNEENDSLNNTIKDDLGNDTVKDSDVQKDGDANVVPVGSDKDRDFQKEDAEDMFGSFFTETNLASEAETEDDKDIDAVENEPEGEDPDLDYQYDDDELIDMAISGKID